MAEDWRILIDLTQSFSLLMSNPQKKTCARHLEGFYEMELNIKFSIITIARNLEYVLTRQTKVAEVQGA